MAKRITSLSKANQIRISKWIKSYVSEHLHNDIDEFTTYCNNLILDEVRCHKECTEKSVVEAYIDAFVEYIEVNDIEMYDSKSMEESIKTVARKSLVMKYTVNHSFNNNIDIYFNDVKREYILHPMNESDKLEFLPENRDIFIKNNLKLVINCAKRYRNLGIPFEDLIQTGNYGLLVAFEKFDKDRANLRTAIMKNIDSSEKTTFTYEDAKRIIEKSFTYDKDLERTIKLLPDVGFSDAESFRQWTMTNVKTAVFASVAFQWIKAYILMELTKMATVVRTPKSSKKNNGLKDLCGDDDVAIEMCSSPVRPPVISLDSVNPHTNDNYHDNQIAGIANETFVTEDNMMGSTDIEQIYKDIIARSLSSLSDINRRIIKKRYGIGYPCALNVADIAESEGIAISKVKTTINECISMMNANMTDNDRETLSEIFEH